MRATIHLDTQHHAGPVDRRIFGGFLEHLGRAVYGGVYDPGNPLSDERGFRRDVLDALRPLAFSVMRYPGGNFVSAYDWTDGIGPREARPRRPDFAWKSVETNQFGTDEFLAWCRALGAAPMLAVNLGTGTPARAAHLLEYCNLPAGTSWADRRAANGHPEPYGVALWCLGNEMDGPWQAGHAPAEVYGRQARMASALMKGLDPTIQTVACGSSGRGMGSYLEWDRTVLEIAWDTVDFISAHRYSGNWGGDSASYLAEGVEIDRILADYAGLLAYVRGVKKSAKRVYLSFDEWNVWYRARGDDGNWAEAPPLLEEVYNLEDALVCAQYLMAFLRRADLVKVACLAQVVNVIAPVLTRPDGVLLQTIYWPFALIAASARGIALAPAITAPTYTTAHYGEVPALDAAATYDAEAGTLALFLVNRDRAALTVEIAVADAALGAVLHADLLTGEPHAANTWEAPRAVLPSPGRAEVVDGRLRVTAPGTSFMAVRAKVRTAPAGRSAIVSPADAASAPTA